MKVVLAYSGGLDTSFCIAYLRERYGADVTAVTCNLGQRDDFASVHDRALAYGASSQVLLDLREEFFERFLSMAIRANARYEKAYPLPLFPSRIPDRREGRRRGTSDRAEAIAHGNTGLGNDQFRYDIPARVLSPDLKVIAPVREGSFTRQQEWDFIAERGLPLPPRPADKLYSIADNIWGCFRGHIGDANDPAVSPPDDVFLLVARGDQRRTGNCEVEIEFDRGVPVGFQGERMHGVAVIEQMNALLGSYGCGFVDYVESSVFGTKIRQTVEGPAALALITAHEDLERLTLSRRQLSTKLLIEQRWAEYAFDGLWVDPACRDLEAFIVSSQETVSGKVSLEVAAGGVVPIKRSSSFSLYRPELYTYLDASLDHKSGESFGELWGRGTVVAARVKSDHAAQAATLATADAPSEPDGDH